mmetsp:Transcript_40953/g.68573  ORF Transcript_40953/g.68573 Transcript_40953/m.68573 type:complete len:111 (+) Transcript_40953:46-378(+)
MRRVWGRGNHVQCIHPGNQCLKGHEEVLRGWEQVLQGGAPADTTGAKIPIVFSKVEVYATDTMAFVTCLEVVTPPGPPKPQRLAGLIATNVFEKQDGEWKIIHHQASPSL